MGFPLCLRVGCNSELSRLLIAFSSAASQRQRCHLAGGQTQARQVEASVLWVAQARDVRHHDGGQRAQPLDDLPRIVEPPRMRIARGEIAIWLRVARVFLHREEE